MESEGTDWLGIDLGSVSTDELQSELLRLESLIRRARSIQLGLISEADRRQVPLGDGCGDTAEWVAAHLDVSSEEARTLERLSKRLGGLAEIRNRLAAGEMSLGRAEALSRVATAECEADWLERTWGRDLAGVQRLVARQRRVTRARERERHRASYVWLQPSLDEAWVRVHGGLAGPAGQIVIDALGRRADRFPPQGGSRAYRQALALETICLDSLNGETSGSGSGASVTAFVDVAAGQGTGAEAGAELAAGPRIGPDYLQELICEGTVRIVGLDNLKPVVATQSARTIPQSVRDFVLWRDGKCRARGCHSTYRLQPHHIHPRSHQGGHDPDNLITLCWFHHHVVVHRRGMHIEQDPDGSIRFRLPQDTRAPP